MLAGMDERITDRPPKPWGAVTGKPPGWGSHPRGDEPGARRWWKWLLLLGIIPLAAWGYDLIRWRRRNLFFGGASGVEFRPDGTLAAAGDPRRGGHGIVVE